MITFRQRDYGDLVGLFRRATQTSRRLPSLTTMVRLGHVIKIERGLYRIRPVIRRVPRD